MTNTKHPHYTAILRAAASLPDTDSLRPALEWALDRLQSADHAAAYVESSADALRRAMHALAPEPSK